MLIGLLAPARGDVAWRVPTATRIDRRLVLGSLAFGIGWGVAAMLAGMARFELAEHLGKRRGEWAQGRGLS